MKSTTPIIINDLIKVGTNVPEGAIKISDFNFQKDNLALTTLNKNDNLDNVQIDSISSIQGRIAIDYRYKSSLLNADQNAFEKSIDYLNDEYEGTLNLSNVDFKEHTNIIEKDYPTVKKIIKTGDTIPAYIIINDKGGFNGKLYLDRVFSEKENENENEQLESSYYNFSSFIPVFVCKINGSIINDNTKYTEEIKKTYIKEASQCRYQIITKVITQILDSSEVNFPMHKYVDGKLYLLKGEVKGEIVETFIKHYGTCRYWGGGASSSNNYYGDPDNRFRVHGWTAKGFMSDKLPAPTYSRYGHKMSVVTKHPFGKYPVDFGGYWNTSAGEKKGVVWQYDIEEAKKYGGSSDHIKGGAVWASAFSNKPFPPQGYSNDCIGGGHLEKNPGNNSKINQNGKIITKNGPQRTSTMGFYNAGGWYNKWFRDIVMFYRGKTTKIQKKAEYTNTDIKYIDTTYKSIEIIEGLLKVSGSKKIETQKNTYVYECFYTGKVKKKHIEYSGVATYRGNVFKKYYIKANEINSIKKNTSAYISKNGEITLLNGSANLGRSYIEMTNLNINGEGLFYKYVCTTPLDTYNPALIDKLSKVSNVRIDSRDNDLKYLFKATKNNEDKILLTIYFNKHVSYKDNVYVSFINNNEHSKELVNTELYMTQGIDFTASVNNSGEYIYSYQSSEVVDDTRRKIDVTFKLCTNSGAYESDVYDTKVINRKYAYGSELATFHLDYMQVNITGSDGEVLTVKEIVARDCKVSVESLKNEKFYILILSSNGVVDTYTNTDGNLPVFLNTYEDTGTLLNNEYTGGENSYICKISIEGKIYDGVIIKETGLGLRSFINSSQALKNKARGIGIYFNSFKISNEDVLIEYKSPSDKKVYDEIYGRPYVKVRELITDTSCIKLSYKYPLNKDMIKIIDTETQKEIQVKYLCKDSIELYDNIDNSKDIVAEYYSIEDYVMYDGYQDKDTYYYLDTNTDIGHYYTDPKTLIDTPSSNLFNKAIYIYAKPIIVKTSAGEVLYDNKDKPIIFHKIDDEDIDRYSMLIGCVYVNNIDKNLINVIDFSRSNIIGGGVKDKYLYNKDVKGIHDVIPKNTAVAKKSSTIITSIDTNVNVRVAEVNNILKEHIPVGVLNIIRRE